MPIAPAVRDGPGLGLPKAVFGRLSARFHTPVVNLVITGIIGPIAIFLDVATSTSFINFGAFTAFTLVNASVVFHYVRQRRAGHQLNPLSYVMVPVIGAVVCAYLPSQLDSNAITLGLSWLVLGIVVLGLITRGFKAAPPGMTLRKRRRSRRPPEPGRRLSLDRMTRGKERA